MSATDDVAAATPRPAVSPGWAGVGPGVAVLAAATGSAFLRWPADDTHPGPLAIVVLLATIAAGGLLLAAGRRVSGAAHVAAWLGGLGALAAAAAALEAVDDLVRGGADDAPAPVVLFAAAVLAAVAGVRAHRDDLRWFVIPDGPPPRRSATIRLVGLAVVLATVPAVVRYASDDAGRVDLSAGDERAMNRAELLADATTVGRFRVTGVARGWVVAAAGPYVLVERADLEVRGVTAVDARSGAVRWSASGPWRGFRATWSGDGFVALAPGGVVLLDAATGAVRWRRDDLPAIAVAGAQVGPAVVGAEGDVVTVLDPATGATVRELRRSACPNGPRFAPGPDVVVTCRLTGGRYLAEVFGPSGPAPTWSGHLANASDVRSVAPGVVLAYPGGPDAPTTDGVLVDAASGAELRAVPAAVMVAATRGRVVALVGPDGVVERWDADARATLGTATLDGGDEYDAADVGNSAWRLVGGSLVAARRDGFGSAGSPASARRFGVVAWDVATGARVARTLTGRVLTDADRKDTDDPVLTDEVAVVPVRLDTPDGPGRVGDHGLLVSLQG